MKKLIDWLKQIENLNEQKHLIKKEIKHIVFSNCELDQSLIDEINTNKLKIKEINDKLNNIKEEVKDFTKNNSFKCCFSTVTENGVTTNVFKINGEEVTKCEFFKKIKENFLIKKDLLHKIYEELECGGKKPPFMGMDHPKCPSMPPHHMPPHMPMPHHHMGPHIPMPPRHMPMPPHHLEPHMFDKNECEKQPHQCDFESKPDKPCI